MNTRQFAIVWAVCGGLIFQGPALKAADSSVADLVKNLKSADEAAKIKTIDELGQQHEKSAEAVAAITELLKDKSANVRSHAVWSLGAIGAPAKSAAPALAELLKDADPGVRRNTVKALQAIQPGPDVMIPLVVKLLEDNDPAIRSRVLTAIAEAGPKAVPGLIQALKNEKATYWALLVLRDIGPDAKDAVAAISELLKDSRPQIRREAVLTLGAMNDAAASALPDIAKLVGDAHANVAATFVLGQWGKIPADAEKTVQTNSKSDNKLLSTVSLWALARVHPDDKELRVQATEQLIGRLKEKDPFVRVAAARALAALPPAPEITAPIWEKALKDADETTVHHALDALAALGPQAVPRLTEALKHEKFREQIAYVLGRIGAPAAPATDALVKLVDDKNSHVAHAALIAIGNIGPDAKAAVPALTKVIEQPDDKNGRFGAAAFALGRMGPAAKSAEAALTGLLKNSDDSVRLLSAWALTEIDPTSAENAAKTVPVLIVGLSMEEVAERLMAVQSLSKLGALAKDAAAALKKVAASDTDTEVKETAAKALKATEEAAAPAAASPSQPATSVADAIKPGDAVSTTEDKVEVGLKGEKGDFLPKGTKLTVMEIRGSWVGVKFTVNGESKIGWVLKTQIAKP